MPREGAQALARAMREVAHRSFDYKNEPPLSGIVRRLAPLTVEVTSANLVLDEDEVELSHAVRKYDFQHGIAIGDTILLVKSADGDYTATSVIAVESNLAGLKHPHTEVVGQRVGGGNLAGASVTVDGVTYDVDGGTVAGTVLKGRVPYHDKNGDYIGDVPLI